MYRIIFQNWSKEKAIEELKNGSYGFHTQYINIPQYINSVNIEQIRNSILMQNGK
jgi:hypothetical protein